MTYPRESPIAVLDACVLFPAPVRDLLLHIAAYELYQPKWSDAINEEWIRNLLAKRPDLKANLLQKTAKEMLRAFPDAIVGDYPELPEGTLPDSGDHHVLSAAITCNANYIVTFNLKDFPNAVLSHHKIEALSPDNFILTIAKRHQEYVMLSFRRQVECLRNPPRTELQVMDTLEKCGLKQTVAWLRRRYPNPTGASPSR